MATWVCPGKSKGQEVGIMESGEGNNQTRGGMKVDFALQNNKKIVLCPIKGYLVDYRLCKICRFNKKIAETYTECDYPFFAKETIESAEVKKVMAEIDGTPGVK